ncbi:hypothetical protein OH76DRAFT_1380310 [Lentinus brumalis]|uniref:GmrSD restriction endonucleases N-terminal domain-containing protein n=1 Tax=Lentinus brumalis TaxID=2498619 RepID=A0A371DDZ7_9APHY|nr:hypothetical protein OH76DRAFT_1380310 [Polyporus brumalis]
MLSDWESSLTELSSDEDEYLPSKASKKKAPPRQAKNEYKASGSHTLAMNISNALRPYRTTTYTAKSLYDQIIDNTIHLDPEYQRDIVWSEAKQSGLIDSILRNYYIPPVLFAVTAHDDGSQTRVCIDGKQRLTSIQLVTNKKYWYKPAAGETRLILPKPLMQAFANKQITCIEYDGLLDDEEREIFQRVQLGVALTAAERMQAIPGPWPSLIREAQAIILGDGGFGEDLDWGHDRGRDFQCLATIIFLIDSQPTTTFPGSVKLEKWLQSSKPVSPKTRKAVLETFHIFVALVKDKKYKVAFQKPSRVSPVEFSMIGLLIFLNKEKFSFVQLSNAIWQLRADVRKYHDDVRANSKVTKTIFAFLHKGLKQSSLPSDGKGDTPAAVIIRQKMSETAEDDVAELSPAPKVKKEKRRRPQEPESSDDSDYEKAPPKRRASMPSAASSSRPQSSKTPVKTSVSRKASAPTKASTSRATGKAPAKTARSTGAAPSSPAQTNASTTSSQPSTPVAAKPPSKVTSRTTRTAQAAAGDMYFPPEPSTSHQRVSIPLAVAMSRAKQQAKLPPKPGGQEPVVKMEIDRSPSISHGIHDDNAMAVDESTQERQRPQQQATVSTAVQSSSTAPHSTSNTPTNPAARHASSGMTLPRTAALSVNTSVTRNSSTALPSLPVPPPPPPLSAGTSPSIAVTVPRFAAMTIHDARSPPTAPRSDRDRDRRRTSDGDWDMDRGRDRDRDRYDRDRDYERGRSRTRERGKEREWERPDRDSKRGGRSRESDRDRYRYGRERRKDW